MRQVLLLLSMASCCRCLTPYYPPYIYKGFLSDVKEGSKLRVLCFIPFLGDSNHKDEDGVLHWSWQRYGGIEGDDPIVEGLKPQNLPGGIRSQILIEKVLTFPRVLRKHEGVYWCNFTSPEHTGSDKFELKLRRNFTLKAKQNTQVFLPGGKDPVWILEANFNTSLIDEVLWKKNYRLFPSCEMDMLKTSSKYKVTTNGSNIILTIENADFEDTNNYNNLFFKSSALELVFYLEVNFRFDVSWLYEDDIDETVEIVVEKYENLPGSKVLATCTVANERKNSVVWKFLFKKTGPGMFWEEKKWKYEEIKEENGASFRRGIDANGNRFEVMEWRMTSSGLLACTVEDNGQTLGSDVKHVCVSSLPLTIFLEGPPSVAEGLNILFTCEVPQCQLFGDETFTWYHKSPNTSYPKKVSKDFVRNISLTKSELSIRNFTANDIGFYTCEFTTVAVGYSVQETLNVSLAESTPEIKDGQESTVEGSSTTFKYEEPDTHEEIVQCNSDAFYGFLLVPAALLASLATCYWRRRRKRDYFKLFFRKELTKPVLFPNPTLSFPRDRLVLGKSLEPGLFGEMFRGEAYGLERDVEKTTVFVKLVRKDADKMVVDSVGKEFQIVSSMGQHPNVLKLLGLAVTRLEIAMIYEYCSFGRLLKYLRDNRHRFSKQSIGRTSVDASGYVSRSKSKESPLDKDILLGWAFQIARGMEWLRINKIVHGDLAARNVMLAADNVVKIIDFCVACDIFSSDDYQMKKNVKIPVRWMAPESINNQIFTPESDVWSFGVTIWEIFTLGDLPYSEHSSAQTLIQALHSGERLKKPLYASHELYALMRSCWDEDVNGRPSFHQLTGDLHDFIGENAREMAVYLDPISDGESAQYLSMFL